MFRSGYKKVQCVAKTGKEGEGNGRCSESHTRRQHRQRARDSRATVHELESGAAHQMTDGSCEHPNVLSDTSQRCMFHPRQSSSHLVSPSLRRHYWCSYTRNKDTTRSDISIIKTANSGYLEPAHWRGTQRSDLMVQSLPPFIGLSPWRPNPSPDRQDKKPKRVLIQW